MALTGPYLECLVNWSSSSASYTSKLYYGQGSTETFTYSQENMKTCADAILAKIGTALRAALPSYIMLNPVTVRVKGSSVEYEDQSSEDSAAGTYTGNSEAPENDVMPEGNQVVIQRRTGLSGRSKRGRVFLPFIPEQLADNSTLTENGIDKYKLIATKFSQNVVVPAFGTLVPKTPDYKNGILVTVTQCRVVSEIMSRRDRRMPKRPVYFGAPTA